MILFPNSLRYALITFVLRYALHSGDEALTQVIWVLRKPTRVFLLSSYVKNRGGVKTGMD